jgi:hypothetical protein
MSAIFHEKKSATADRIMACIPIEVSSLCEKFRHVAFFFYPAQHNVDGALVTKPLSSIQNSCKLL